MSLGVAIVGSGIFATEEHLPAVQACQHLTLRAIYSRSLKSAKALHQAASSVDVDLYADDAGSGNTYHDLLLREDIKGVIIALPIMNQPEFIEAALAAGKHVLSEKPIADNIFRAKQLIRYAEAMKSKGGQWSVAENFRFLDSFRYGAEQVQRLGKVLGFRVKVFGNVKAGTKYFETDWRKKPSYQGGFLLDGGVHFTAGTRMLVGASPVELTAYSTLLQKHLPPVDTVNSIWLMASGVSGTFQVSFGTTLSGSEYTVACEKGSVTIVRSLVIVREGEEKEGKITEKDFPAEGSGVKQEVAAWAEGMLKGQANTLQNPSMALADLELLEKMLKSGEQKGTKMTLELQA